MNKTEMLLKLLAQSGWVVTPDTDAEGNRIAVAADNSERAE